MRVFRQFVPEETNQVSVIAEYVRLGMAPARLMRARVAVICGGTCRLTVHARHKSPRSPARMTRHHLGRFDFHAMNWPILFRLRSGIVRWLAIRLGPLMGVVLQRRERSFGLARRFQSFAHHWIDVITTVDKWHVASEDFAVR
jgi:hypothetical protein